ncbi:Trk-type K+ transport system membrane component [Arthrobacter sp. JUb119]|uniref:TrkH family potassium uptake protein n=1 Tax=Micrococcaceae TaxID=1268 RepID=UPI000CFC305B|nr:MULTISPECIES: potassium transporter TrkG [unclassified Arthrobacter]MCS3491039.1 Trk-type K+ transport system membrane component [Arthrobacter sp. JUb119]PQZ88747.1 potassium transporter Trk [Arthrobacter sp. MYb222]PRB74217.1 potassium transporter Trk [Arthrobacter sp. MYb214]TDU27654.1 Trk-type K+ transport system membrane component [Arthrobacter sp. JUb115]
MSTASASGPSARAAEMREQRRKKWLTVRIAVADFTVRSPARLTLGAFLLAITLFTSLLAAPFSSATGEATALHDALFTAVSAVCVTGLTTVSTAVHWSFAGQLIMLVATFMGGLGILTLASIMSLAVSRKLGVRAKLMAQNSMNSSGASALGEVSSLLRIVILTAISLQAVIALFLIPRFYILGESVLSAIWHGIFYAVSAFNNAGFTPHSDGLVPYETDLWILGPLMAGVFTGSLGFPVIMVLLAHKFNMKKWNLHTKLTMLTTTILLFAGSFLWLIFEWANPKTIGGLSISDKLIHGFFASTMTRSGGFNLVDQNDIHQVTILLTDALMFAGGGSASTAGGIKVTTIAVMFLAILAEVRGDTDAKAFGRQIPQGTMRVAISVVAMGASLVMVATGALVTIDESVGFSRALFESISAFATVGLSSGVSQEVPPAGKYVLSALMFAGRIGSITLASALTMRHRNTLFRLPEERPLIG